MVLVINFSAVRTSGTRNYCEGFINALPERHEGENLIVLLPADLYAKLSENVFGGCRFYTSVFFRSSLTRIFWEQFILPYKLLQWRASAILSGFDIATLLSPIPVLLAVRNPMPIHLNKGWHSNSSLKIIRAYLQKWVAHLSTLKAKRVFYPTVYAAETLGAVFNVPSAKIRVINHGVDFDFWRPKTIDNLVPTAYGLVVGQYFLFVSMLYYYKRPDKLIQAFAIHSEYYRARKIKVAVVGGGVDPKYFGQLRDLVRQHGLEDSVKLLGFVPKDHLPSLYAGARAFVLPTILETFGQPFVEALAAGIPIIAADLPFAREVCGDAALYFAADHVDQLAEVMKTACEDDLLLQELHAKAESRSVIYSWSREARETIQLLRDVAQL
jgi:glycosyltransferase involved in cell wall biosynthesis